VEFTPTIDGRNMVMIIGVACAGAQATPSRATHCNL
jgi:hypothetical protein